MVAISKPLHLQGIALAAGIGIGPLFFLSLEAEPFARATDIICEVSEELQRFHYAIELVTNEIKQLQEQQKNEQNDSQESIMLLGSQLQLLRDPVLIADVEEAVEQQQCTAQMALRNVVAEYQKNFLSIGDPFFTERFQDMKDIACRLIAQLQGTTASPFAIMPAQAVVITTALAAAQAIEAAQRGASAFITAQGASASHAAIIAKAKGIPYVSQADINALLGLGNALAVVDGSRGEVFVNPTSTALRHYTALAGQMQRHFDELAEETLWPAQTFDGYHVHLSANIDMISEVQTARQYGCSGIGLFRTEYLFLSEIECPSEAEQHKIYYHAAEQMSQWPIVIRTFDIGGDKLPLFYQGKEERNPFLGCRAIRLLLQQRELFKTQLRAIIRANILGNVSVLFPMISTLTELQQAKELVKEVEKELIQEEQPFISPRIGCMIEVPTAAIIADLLAKECDFLSIGTNDLVQYALAVDRENYLLRELYSPADPGVLRLIKQVALEAHQHDIPVAICGEVAADPRFTPLLLGLGIQEFSVAPRHLPAVKKAIRRAGIVAATQLTDYVLTLGSAREIEAVLETAYQKVLAEELEAVTMNLSQ